MKIENKHSEYASEFIKKTHKESRGKKLMECLSWNFGPTCDPNRWLFYVDIYLQVDEHVNNEYSRRCLADVFITDSLYTAEINNIKVQSDTLGGMLTDLLIIFERINGML